MLNAHCDLPASEQPEIVPDSVPVVPSLLDEYRRVFEEFGMQIYSTRTRDDGSATRDAIGSNLIGYMQTSRKDSRFRSYISVSCGQVTISGFIPREQLPRFKAAIRAALEIE